MYGIGTIRIFSRTIADGEVGVVISKPDLGRSVAIKEVS